MHGDKRDTSAEPTKDNATLDEWWPKEIRKVGVKFTSNKFQAFCTYCQWSTGFYGDQEFAYDLLARHTKERQHKTNCASPTRFVV